MAEKTTRTVWGSSLQTAMFYNLRLDFPDYSTLNERFNVEATAALPDGVYPTIDYYAIGLGGAKVVYRADGIPIVEAVQHLATDASLYKPFPFVLRAVGNDLTPAQRVNYAMRTIETYNGQAYVAYYLKRIDKTQAVLNREIKTINNGIVTVTKFTPTAANLSPTPPDISNVGTNVITSDYASVYSTIPMVFTKDECTELLAAATIIYGSEDYATISEIAICSGYDKLISLPDGTNFNEAICVQATAFLNTFHYIKANNNGIAGNYEIGVMEPLLKLV